MPEMITIGEAPIGRATQAAIEEALAAEVLATTSYAPNSAPDVPVGVGKAVSSGSRRKLPEAGVQPAEIFEIATFVVRGEEIFSKASDEARREFVATRLLHRLPAVSMNEVVRIDISRAAEELTVILRVWCRVGATLAH
jgi:hypothetical protein